MKLAWLLAIPLAAHDLYLLPPKFTVTPGERITVAIHNGDAFPESEGPPPLERLRDATLTTASGSHKLVNPRIDGNAGNAGLLDGEVKSAGSVLLSVRTLPNLIQLPAKQFTEYLSEEGLADVIQWRVKNGQADKPGRERYSKYAKSLLTSGSSSNLFKTPLGLVLEIVPEAISAKSMPVRLLFRGKPAAGIQIELNHADGERRIAGATDSRGRLEIAPGKPGVYRLHALLMERCADPKAADWESFWASFTFEIANGAR